MKQETYNELVRALVFASTCDCCADTEALGMTVDALEVLLEENPELTENVNLDGVYLYGEEKHAEEPEKYKKLVKLFGDKLKIDK